jgi:hypothetical protein
MGTVPTPTEDRFRALARSSPWRFRTLHLTRTDARGGLVEAWLERPGHLRVRTDDGRTEVVRGLPYTLSAVRPDGTVAVPWRRRLPADVAVELDEDGLVVDRPPRHTVDADDPMWRDYTWVAMLDPVELATGTTVHELARTTRHGRETWWARMSAAEGYDPRCSCCPLLWGEVSEGLETAAGAPPGRLEEGVSFPESWLVGLDAGTGVVVSLRPLGGDRDDLGFEVTLHEVDAAPGVPASS